MARFPLALYAVQTVNVSILANSSSGSAQIESDCERLQRFPRQFEIPYAELDELVVRMLGLPGPYTLAMDRTNWKVGAMDLNILMHSIVYRGGGVPVVWVVLPKDGNSDTGGRGAAIEIFLDLFGAHSINIYRAIASSWGANGFDFLTVIGSSFRGGYTEILLCVMGADSMRKPAGSFAARGSIPP